MLYQLQVCSKENQYTYIHSFFLRFFSQRGHYRVLSIVLVLYSRFLLLIYCICSSSVYLSLPISQFIPLPTYSLVTVSLLSISMTLLLLLSRFSRVRLLATPWTVAHQAPPSMGFSRQECWSGVPLPSPINKQYHKIFVFLCLTYFTLYNRL